MIKCWEDGQILSGSFVSLCPSRWVVHCVGFRTFLDGRFANLRMRLHFAMSVAPLRLVGGHFLAGWFLTHII